MIQFNEKRDTAIFYTCGVCNLNCRYCTIDKNPVLKDIDNELEKSFEGDYYFERLKKYFPRNDQLKRIETWGGEPFLKMERIYPLVHKVINHYPYFKEMFSSTNFSYNEWLDQFMGLMNVFAQYPYRQFEYTLQLSVDGPEYINDANRGIGVTKRCIANFDKLLDIIRAGKFPSNVHLFFSIKGTWDLDCIRKLNNKEKLIEFFQFYEDAYIEKVYQLNNPNILCGTTIPNTAVPAPTTQEDGRIFAELVQKCREIEEENKVMHYFKCYNKITPFSNVMDNDTTFLNICAQCGSGSNMVGFLPHNMISACHEGFTLLVDQYKAYAQQRSDANLTVTLNKFFEDQPTPMYLTDDEYINHERKMEYINMSSPAQLTQMVITIIALALAGEIEQKYLNECEALHAARYILFNTAFCIKANYAVSGNFITNPFDLPKLLLNGALPYLEQNNSGCQNQGGCDGNCCNTCR